MFIKKTRRTVNGKKYQYYHLVQSVRSPKGPRHKTLANLSHLPQSIIQQLDQLLNARKPALIADLTDFFKESYLYGPIAFFLLFMRNIGVLSALKPIPMKSRILLVGIIINRIVNPRSKLATVSWLKGTAFSKICGLNADRLRVNKLYQAMDVLYRHLDQVLDNFNQPSENQRQKLLLYDITSTYFEGNGPQSATHGYSRDKRPDRPQILLGLCLNAQGFPIYFRIFRGNMQDKQTVIDMLEGLNTNFYFDSYIFVGDRGMVTIKNLERIKTLGLDYLVALTHTESRQLLHSLEFQQLELYDSQIPVEILGDTRDGSRYILCGSPYRRAHDEKLFEKLLTKGREALESVQAMVDKGVIKDRDKILKRAQKKLTKSGADPYYDFTYENGQLEIIEHQEKIALGRQLCGYYILKTTQKHISAQEAEHSYKQLQTVEEAFREIKELINIRPIYHWTDKRVFTHVYLCILSQAILRQCRKILQQSGWIYEQQENSVHTFLQSLSQIQLGKFSIEGMTKWIVSALTDEHKKLLKLFNIREKEFMDYNKMEM